MKGRILWQSFLFGNGADIRVARSHDRGLENVKSWRTPALSLPAAKDYAGGGGSC